MNKNYVVPVDMFDQDLSVGDKIAYVPTNLKYLAIGFIKEFSKSGKTLTVDSSNRRCCETLKVDEQYKKATMEKPELFI
jgi:hypothetical protein